MTDHPSSARLTGESGGASIIVLALVVVLVQVLTVAGGTVGRAIVERNRAQIAADAVALAGVADPVLAERVAVANGARIIALERRGGPLDRTVDATVAVGRGIGIARATLAP